MAWLGDLLIRLKAETADFQQDLGKAAYLAEQSGKRMERAFSSAQKALGALAITAAAYQYAERTKELIDMGDATGKLAERTGIAVGQLSAYSYAAKLANVSQEDLQTGLKKLGVNMANAAGGGEMAKAFKAIGVSVKDTNGNLRNTDDVLSDVAAKFAGYADGPAKAALAVELFGKAGDKLIPFLNKMREATDEARRLNLTFGADFAAAAERYNDNMTRIAAQSDATKIRLAEGILPRISDIAEEFIQAAAKGEKFIGMLRALSQISGFSDAKGAVADQKELIGLFEKRETINRNIERIRNTEFAKTDAGEKSLANSKRELDLLDKRAAVLKAMQSLGDPRDRDQNDRTKDRKVNAPIVTRPDAEGLAEVKKYTSALQQLELQLGKLYDMSAQEKVLYETSAGSLKDLTAAHKANLIEVSKQIDKRDQMLKGLASEDIHRKALNDAVEQGDAAMKGFFIEQRKALDQKEFELSLIGLTTQAQEQLTAARNIDLAAKQAGLGVDAESLGAPRQLEDIRKRAEAFKEQTRQVNDARRDAERSWLTGSKRAFDTYIDLATNAALQAEGLFVRAFTQMEDALVNFVKTGKMDFKSLADSIITDLIRIQARQVLAQGMSAAGGGGGLFGSLGSLFGFGSKTGTPGSAAGAESAMSNGSWDAIPSFDVGTNYVPHDMVAKIHQGEKITPAAQNNGGAGGGNVFYIDARGADKEGLTALASSIKQINGSIEKRAVAAVFNAQSRGSRA